MSTGPSCRPSRYGPAALLGPLPRSAALPVALLVRRLWAGWYLPSARSPPASFPEKSNATHTSQKLNKICSQTYLALFFPPLCNSLATFFKRCVKSKLRAWWRRHALPNLNCCPPPVFFFGLAGSWCTARQPLKQHLATFVF